MIASDNLDADVARSVRTRRRRRTALVLTLVGVAGLVFVYTVPPTGSRLFPPCLFYVTLGWHCPGCGATRCLHALLHGRIAEAASYNVLFFAALPVIAFLAGRSLLGMFVGRSPSTRPVPGWLIVVLAVFVVSFGVLRNLDYPPFDRLAPGKLFRDADVSRR